MTLKTAMTAPTPNASSPPASPVKSGVLASVRRARRTSWTMPRLDGEAAAKG